MTPAPDCIEAARLTRSPTAWESRFERYERLTRNAGFSEEEACRIVTAAMLDELADRYPNALRSAA